MSSTPKFFHQAMTGAPVLSGTVGSLIAILDACLVNGFGLKTADSVTVAGGIATMNFSTGHSFEAHAIALVAGATPAGLNGEQRILSVTTNTATFATAAPDGTATGAITAKVAPLGWIKVYSGTNKAVYKPSAIEASGALLRVDDTGTTAARVRMYEAMTDIDTGFNVAPTEATLAGGFHWWKSAAASTLARDWVVFGDDRNVYVAPAPHSTAAVSIHTIYAFGDLDSYKSGDAFPGVLTGEIVAVATVSSGNAAAGAVGGNSMRLVRSHTGIGTSVLGDRRPVVGNPNVASGVDSYLGGFPAPVNNGLFLTRIVVNQAPISSNGPRGLLPGLLYVPQSGTVGGLFPRGAVVNGTGEFAGRKVYAVPQSNSSLTAAMGDGSAFFDLTGPWRN